MNLQQFLSNGGFAKMMSTVIQSVFVLGIGFVIAFEVLNNQPINPYLLTFLGVILGHQATLLTGVQSSSDLVNALNQGLPDQTQAIADNTNALAQKIAALHENTAAIQQNTALQQPPDPSPTQPKLQVVQGATTNG